MRARSMPASNSACVMLSPQEFSTGRDSGTQSLPDSWSETMIGSRPSLGKITAALSRQVRKRQSERVPRACSK